MKQKYNSQKKTKEVIFLEKLKIGVIGVGNMGRNHLRILAEESMRFELVGIFDADIEHAILMAEHYGTKAFPDVKLLLMQVKAVIIAVPSSLHKEYGLLAASYGVSALIEKPLATNSKDAQTIADSFLEKGLQLAVGHIERFNPVIQELDKLLHNEQIFYLEAHRYSPFSGSGRIQDVSVVEDLMIHDVDLVCHLMEPHHVTWVRGYGEKIRSQHVDFSTCMLGFNTNAHAIINASRVSQDKERMIRIQTLDNYICADLLLKSLTVSKSTGLMMDGAHETTYRQDSIQQKIFVPLQEPLRLELLSFYEAVVHNAPIEVTGEVGIRAIQICEEVGRYAAQSNKGDNV